MKTALNLLIAYLTCDDPVMITKWQNIMASFWHKDAGVLVTNIVEGADEITITLTDGDDVESDLVIPIYVEPETWPQSKIEGLGVALGSKVDKVNGQGLSDVNFTQALFDKLDNLTQYVHPNTHPISMIDGLQAIIDQQNTTISQLSDTIVNATQDTFLRWNTYRLFKKEGNLLTYPQTGDEIMGRGDGTLESGDNVHLEVVNDMPDISQVVKADYKFFTSYK